MEKITKEKWVEALRSGKYAQTDAQLVKIGTEGESDSYCCLGVLSDRVLNDDVLQEMEHFDRLRHKYITVKAYPDTNVGFLRPELIAELGLDRMVPFEAYDYIHPGCYEDTDDYSAYPVEWDEFLMELNDEGFSFDEIADVIEKYL